MNSMDAFNLIERMPKGFRIDRYEFVVGSVNRFQQDLWGKRRAKPFLAVVGQQMECDLAVRIRSLENREHLDSIFGLAISDSQTGIRLVDATFAEVHDKEAYETEITGFNPSYMKTISITYIDHLKREIIPLDVTASDPKTKRLLVSNGHAVWLLDVLDREE